MIPVPAAPEGNIRDAADFTERSAPACGEGVLSHGPRVLRKDRLAPLRRRVPPIANDRRGGANWPLRQVG